MWIMRVIIFKAQTVLGGVLIIIAGVLLVGIGIMALKRTASTMAARGYPNPTIAAVTCASRYDDGVRDE